MVHVEISRPDPDDEPGYRAPPHNEEAEQALLGAVLVNNDVLHKVEDFLRPEHFYIPVHRRIFDAIRLVIEKGQIANPITLKTYFENDEALYQVGGAGYIARLATGATTIINALQYARRIKDHYIQRRLIGIGEDMVNDAYQPAVDRSAEDQIDDAERELFELAEHGRDGESGFKPFIKVSKDAADELQEAINRRTELRQSSPGEVPVVGLSTGFRNLDWAVGGFNRSDLIILAARPGMGKTALVTNIALNIVRKKPAGSNRNGDTNSAGHAVVGMFSLEMSDTQMVNRVLSVQSGVHSDKIRQGDLKKPDIDSLVRANMDLSDVALHIDETPAIPIHTLRARARRLKRREGGLALVIVDYLQLIRPSSRGSQDSRVQEVSEITQGLKALAKELDVPVLACSQLSRAVEQRPDKRPLLSDLRESGSIEQDADIVMFLYRKEYYKREPEPKEGETENSPDYRDRRDAYEQEKEKIKGVTEVLVEKHRHGSTGITRLHFDDKTTKFMDLAHQADIEPY